MKSVAFISFLALMLLLSCAPKEPDEKIDHIILVINDIQKGIVQFRELTGVEPVFGGVHPNSFTQNALVALDRQAYIEILAPRTDIDSIPDWIMQFENLTPSGWAVTSTDIEKTKDKVTGLGFAASDTRAGSRTKPDGATLSWKTFGINDRDTMLYPFFIQWGASSAHPSSTSPAGCEMVSFRLTTAEDGELAKLIHKLNIRAAVEKGTQAGMVLELRTPRGRVTFPNP